MERKDSIRRFLREQFRDDKKSKENKEKDKESKENRENIANATSSSSSCTVATSTESVKVSNTEVKTKSSAYRLFRTVCFENYIF